MIDTHAHYNRTDLKDLKREIQKLNDLSYMDRVINVGLNEQTNEEVLEIAAKHEKFYASLGIHPLQKGNVYSIANMIYDTEKQKIVALGETGLDTQGDLEEQRKKFIETILLANKLGLPIIIHSNNTNEEVIKILKKYFPKFGFVFHCFQPNFEILKETVEMNGYISVGSPITRPNAKKSLGIIKIIPIDHLLIELDYPYMSSAPTTDGRNVFNRIREIRGYDHVELETILDQNARRLFRNLK